MKLTRKGFKAWLESKHPRTVVGKCCLVQQCPLARYTDRTIYPNSEWLPVWARDFAHRVDFGRKGSSITARRALEILEQCK